MNPSFCIADCEKTARCFNHRPFQEINNLLLAG
jgi:hypothetical protein